MAKIVKPESQVPKSTVQAEKTRYDSIFSGGVSPATLLHVTLSSSILSEVRVQTTWASEWLQHFSSEKYYIGEEISATDWAGPNPSGSGATSWQKMVIFNSLLAMSSALPNMKPKAQRTLKTLRTSCFVLFVLLNLNSLFSCGGAALLYW